MILRQWKSIKWCYICAWYAQKLCTILKQPTTFNQECHILSKSPCSHSFQTFTLKARIFRLLLVSPFEFWYYIFQVVRRHFHSPYLRYTNLWVVTCLRRVLLLSLCIIFFRLSEAQAHGAWISFPPPSFFPTFSYKSFLFKNCHNHSFFFIWQYQ